MSLKEKIALWYEGTYEPEPPGSPFYMGTYRRHWTSRIVHTCIDFYRKEWKWVLMFVVGVVGLVVALGKG